MNGSGIFSIDYIKKRIRATDYISVAQLFLQNDFLLERPLRPDDIKSRLLGHWGTCPGINIIYANLKAFFGNNPDLHIVVGPGHGFPALQANLFLDGDLEKIDKKATQDLDGLAYICKNFSWPGGFPSHASPITPGVICEGGELGYALATAYGYALNDPKKRVAVIIGDGEFETATTLASLNLNKLLSSSSNGRVLPILHLNGYKISGPTISARKSERELFQLLRGFGFTPLLIDGPDPEVFQEKLTDARTIFATDPTHPPFLILKTKKGLTGPTYVDGQKVAGNYLAHQIPLKNAKTDPVQLALLEDWLRSYRFDELFNNEDGFKIAGYNPIPRSTLHDLREDEDGLEITEHDPILRGALRSLRASDRGATPATAGGRDPGDTEDRVGSAILNPGSEFYSPAKAFGSCLTNRLKADKDFYLFSPDETTSNKLDETYTATTRAWAMPTEPWDLPESDSGHIIELLSENTLFATMLGHLLAGHDAMMTSYESFFTIITSQILQHLKFLQQSKDVKWRDPIPSANLLSTSTCWRQDHNGFTHQSPALISTLLDRPGNYANCLFPIDDVSARTTFNFMLKIKNAVNLTTFNKTDEPRWIDKNHAQFQFDNGGASIFGFTSDYDPDIILTAAGDIVSREAIYAIKILKQDLPDLKIRFVGINALTHNAIGTTENHLSQTTFDDYFTFEKPIFANFHGYPDTLKHILGQYTSESRIHSHGFIEQGTTTTPLEMLRLNHASRYDLAIDVASYLARPDLVEKYESILNENHSHALTTGLDNIAE